VLGNTATRDPLFSSIITPPGQAVPEFLAMTGPSSSTDPSNSFTTTVTWTAT